MDSGIVCSYRVFKMDWRHFKELLFPNSMEKLLSYLGYFSISFEKITLYTEILTRKVELWIFFTRYTREKTPQNQLFLSKFQCRK